MQNNTFDNAKTNLNKAVNSLKQAWDENPVAVMSAAGVLFAGVAKVLSGVSSFRNSRSWDKEVKRRQERDRNRRYPRV